MDMLKKLTVASLFLFSLSSEAENLTDTITVINQGTTAASLEIPASTKIELSADKQEISADETRTHFKGNAQALVTFPSGEVMKINADELAIGTAMK